MTTERPRRPASAGGRGTAYGASVITTWRSLPTGLTYAKLRGSAWTFTAAILALLLAGGSSPASAQRRAHLIWDAGGLPEFNFISWELGVIGQTLSEVWRRPQDRLTEEEQTDLALSYVRRNGRIGEVEEEIRSLVAAPDAPEAGSDGEADALRGQLAELRRLQEIDRPLVQDILEDQVRLELEEAGLTFRGAVWPPVQFAFIEPPLKLTLSPRERISVVYSRVLQAHYDPVLLGRSEQAIEASTGLSAHISRIGGMAVFPAMVIEVASLPWLLSTIAHEWTHHYLFLFPLGLGYGSSGFVTTVNETASDIIGEEIGERLLRRYYPDLLPPAAGGGEPASCSCGPFALWVDALGEEEEARWERPGRPLAFDYRRAMRETRLHVDALLGAGLVDAAEHYMEARRRYFVAKGYPLRVLNQAYFAFHGSYATGPAASSPIGPQLQRLREQSDDLAHFLETVRWISSPADLERLLQARAEEATRNRGGR